MNDRVLMGVRSRRCARCLVPSAVLGDLQRLRLAHQFRAQSRRESAPCARDVHQLAVQNVPDDHCVESASADRIAADDEFLGAVDPHLHPRTQTLARQLSGPLQTNAKTQIAGRSSVAAVLFNPGTMPSDFNRPTSAAKVNDILDASFLESTEAK